MEPVDIIVIAVICLIIGGASAYIIKAKKSGKKCIGCPDSCSCSSKSSDKKEGASCCGSCSSCHGCDCDQDND